MRKAISILLAVLLVLSLLACTATSTEPAAEPAAEATEAVEATEAPAAEDDPLAAIQNAATFEEVAPYHKAALAVGDYETALVCAKRMVEIDPASQDAQNALAEAEIALLQLQVDGLNASLESGLASVPDPAAYAEYISSLLEATDLTVSLPFVSDYGAAENANVNGITFSNLVQPSVYQGWQGGLLTAQADWIYFSVPNENWAIYKMREGSGNKVHLGEACGCYLNVVGDWLYYCNTNDENKIYKMRTDGSENAKVSDDTGRYLAVIGDWMYYAVEAENNSLYRARLDGSERTMLSGDPMREAYCADDVLYAAKRDVDGIIRANPDASDATMLVPDRAYEYCTYDGAIYYLTDNMGIVIDRVQSDGTGLEEVFRFEGKGGNFAVASGRLIVGGTVTAAEPEGIYVYDLASLQRGVSLVVWASALYTANGDTLYYINGEDSAWYWLNMETGETGALN